MSGRLIISRHKSWHVWNGDNQEKVLRDERIHREKELEIQENEKRQIQKKTLELLGAKVSINTGLSNDSSSASVEQVESKHINLFDEYETKNFVNEEHQKEKEKAAQIKLKRAGIAPLAFADGSLEHDKKRAWYETFDINSCSSSREDTRTRPAGGKGPERIADSPSEKFKRAMDPMKSHLKSEYVIAGHGQASSVVESKPKSQVFERGSNRNNESRGDIISSNRKKRDKGKGRAKDSQSVALMESLRAKRLERELGERRRSAQLLAQTDVFGHESLGRGYER